MIPADGIRHCASCGASAPRETARFCEACGAALPEVAGSPPDPDPRGFEETEERFLALAAHPDFAHWMQHTPPLSGTHWLSSTLVIVLLALLGLAVTAGVSFVCAPIAFVPFALVVVGVLALSRQASRAREAGRAPVERLPALFVGEKTTLSPDVDGGARPGTIAMLLCQDGSRVELRVLEEIQGRLEPGEIGVAFRQNDALIEFGRVPV